MDEKSIEQPQQEQKDLSAEALPRRQAGPEGAKEEQKEKEPEILYHFFYSAHGTAQDFKNLEKEFERADIYVLEEYEWTPERKSMLDKLSQGEITLEKVAQEYDIEKSSSWYREFEIIHNSHKPIVIVDIPERDREFIDKEEETIEMHVKAVVLFIGGKLQGALQKLRSCVINEAELCLAREKRIRENLKKQIRMFLKENSEYADKKEVRVLVNLGGVHTSLYHKLKKKKVSVSREFSHLPMVFNSANEAIRREIFKKEVGDELLARSIIECCIFPRVISITNDSNKADQALRKISSQLTLKDIEQISKNIHEASQEPRTPSFLEFPIEDIVYEVEKLGIKIPDSEEEMDELLQ
ncbi:hypothetical protein MYX07_01385 [Patescibacteria group bacterium AH-259-L07]|nr:hypothetical protein [Patescibacteria group bacterium AH-259-L07]